MSFVSSDDSAWLVSSWRHISSGMYNLLASWWCHNRRYVASGWLAAINMSVGKSKCCYMHIHKHNTPKIQQIFQTDWSSTTVRTLELSVYSYIWCVKYMQLKRKKFLTRYVEWVTLVCNLRTKYVGWFGNPLIHRALHRRKYGVLFG